MRFASCRWPPATASARTWCTPPSAVIVSGSGTHFDPAVVRAFLAVEGTFAEVSRQHVDDAASDSHPAATT